MMIYAISLLKKNWVKEIANIRSYLSDAATQKPVLSLLISKLDYSNSLFTIWILKTFINFNWFKIMQTALSIKMSQC